MDEKTLDFLEQTYNDAMDIQFGACIECDTLVENIDTDAQKLPCPNAKCGKETVYGLQAIIQRFGR